MGSKSKYWHSEVEVEDVGFQPLFGYDLKLCRPIVKKFNEAKTTKEKQELSKQLPKELFCYCRYCGNPVVNSISILNMHRDGSINLFQPSVRTRVVDGKEYELSCCEDCLLRHFKDCPPSAPKYYLMKGNKYAAYSFGYPEEVYKKITSITTGVTLKSMIRKWGEEEGKKRWKEYCNKHSYIASKDSYIDKYGIEEGKKKYYEDRAMTLEMCIKRHGKEKGTKMWNDYCDRQRYTCSKEYYVDKLGSEEGEKKWKSIRLAFSKAGQSTNGSTISAISQELFKSLYEKIQNKDNIYFGSLNKEYELVCDNGSCYFLDFYDKERNIVIEFNGDYWHGNPSIYKSGDLINVHGQQKKVDILWGYEKIRKNNISNQLNNPTYVVVWENEYRKDKKGTIEKLLKYFN